MSPVLIKKEGAVAWLILNKPDKLNVLGFDMAEGLQRCTEDLKNDENIRCVIITGAGDHFMAGGDLDYFKSLIDTYESGDEAAFSKELFDLVHQAILNITSMQKPVIASVKGAVAGFGLSLMLASDIAIAAEDATLSVAYCKIGTTPDGGMTYFLPRAVGQKRAMELALTGQRFSAAQAEKWGMLNQVVATELLEVETLKLAQSLCDGPGDVLARTKQLLTATYDVSLKERLAEEAENFYSSMYRKDFAEGVTSFCERRASKFNQ